MPKDRVGKNNFKDEISMTYQNLNSGNRRMNGRNSSLVLVGSDGPSSESKKSSVNRTILLIC